MPQDYKSKAKPKQNAQPLPGWTWLIAGVAIGLFAAFLVYIAKFNPEKIKQIAQQSKPTEQKSPATKKEPAAAPEEPRFSFYTDLPKIKVEIPAEEIENLSGKDKGSAPPPAPRADVQEERGKTPEPASTPTPTYKENIAAIPRGNAYILQIGSYKSYSEADRLKAKLAFMGVEANIQPISVNKKDRWYRVRVGPYANQNQANAIKQKLRQNNVSAIVLKVGE